MAEDPAVLLECLRSRDPGVRDAVGYAGIAERLSGGAEDGRLAAFGERLVAMLSDDEIQARSFAALVLAEVVARDSQVLTVPPATVVAWWDTFRAWYLAEEDLRGWDGELGWLHAVAHGADAVVAFGRSPRLERGLLLDVLAVARDRVLRPGGVLFADHEEDRVALALAMTLTREELGEEDAVGWLDPLARALGAPRPDGPAPAWAANAARTLRSLYVLVDRGIVTPGDGEARAVPHRLAVLAEVATVLRSLSPFVG